MGQSDLPEVPPPFQVSPPSHQPLAAPPAVAPPAGGPPPSWPAPSTAPPIGSSLPTTAPPHQAFQNPGQAAVPPPAGQPPAGQPAIGQPPAGKAPKGTHWAILVGLLVGGFILGGVAVGLIMASAQDIEQAASDANGSGLGVSSSGDSGSVYGEEEDPENAIARYTEELERRPDSAQLYLWRGNAYSDLYESELANDDYTKAIELDPDNVDYYLARAEHNRWWETEVAIADYLKVVELEPGVASHHIALAGTYQYADNNEAALEHYSIALDLAPDDATTYADRGWLHMEMDNGPAAIADLTAAIEHDPTAARYGSRGQAHFELDQYVEAIADYTEASELDQDSTYYLTQRATAHVANDEPDAALNDYTTAIEAQPRWGPYEQRANLLWDLGRIDEAMADFDLAAENDDVAGRYRRAQALAELGQGVEALADLDFVVDEALASAGDNYDYLAYDYGILVEDALYFRAVTRAGVGQFDGAIADLELVMNGVEGIDRPARPGPVQDQIRQWIEELGNGVDPFG